MNNHHFGENGGGGSRTLSRENSNEEHSYEGGAVVLTQNDVFLNNHHLVDNVPPATGTGLYSNYAPQHAPPQAHYQHYKYGTNMTESTVDQSRLPAGYLHNEDEALGSHESRSMQNNQFLL